MDYGNKEKPNSALYAVFDRHGIEMPNHWSGRLRTKEEAEKLAALLNKGGEYAPYKIKKVTHGLR